MRRKQLRILLFGKARRARDKRYLPHNVSGLGKGRWHSRTAMWASKRKARRKRLISNESRRRNRASA